MKIEKEKISVASPCIDICAMDENTGYCRGCFRTLQEITEWEGCNDARKIEIIDRLASRARWNDAEGPSDRDRSGDC